MFSISWTVDLKPLNILAADEQSVKYASPSLEMNKQIIERLSALF